MGKAVGVSSRLDDVAAEREPVHDRRARRGSVKVSLVLADTASSRTRCPRRPGVRQWVVARKQLGRRRPRRSKNSAVPLQVPDHGGRLAGWLEVLAGRSAAPGLGVVGRCCRAWSSFVVWDAASGWWGSLVAVRSAVFFVVGVRTRPACWPAVWWAGVRVCGPGVVWWFACPGGWLAGAARVACAPLPGRFVVFGRGSAGRGVVSGGVGAW